MVYTDLTKNPVYLRVHLFPSASTCRWKINGLDPSEAIGKFLQLEKSL